MTTTAAQCIIDTNVPKIANQHIDILAIPADMLECVLACAEKIQKILDGEIALILDSGGDIFTEYRQQLSMCGQNGLGNAFMKWVHDNQWNFPESNRVNITKNGSSYEEFPEDEKLNGFDLSDIKFVAVANKHLAKPPIFVASDFKWWIYKAALKNKGILVEFLCPIPIQQVAAKKKKSKN